MSRRKLVRGTARGVMNREIDRIVVAPPKAELARRLERHLA